MAKREFTADSKLGFMRFIQVFNILFILGVAMFLLFVRGTDIHLDARGILIIFELLSIAVTVWLIGHRKIYTRQIVICLCSLVIIAWTIMAVVEGTFGVLSILTDNLSQWFLILYFATSRRAKAVLVQPFKADFRNKELAADRKMWNPKSLDFWMRLLIYFFVFSIMGHWMEQFLQILIINGWFPGTIAGPDSLTWRDNWNPFPIYGIAVVICGLALYPLFLRLREKCPKVWQAYILSFLANTLFCTVAELALGFAFNADLQAWNYSDQFMNFQGQICLLYTMAFGVLSSFITWQLYPLMERQFSYVSKDAFRIIFVASAVLYLLIFVTYNVNPDAMFGTAIDLKNLGNTSA